MEKRGKRLRRLRIRLLGRVHGALDRRRVRGGGRDLTAARVELPSLTIESASRGAGNVYLPTPWTVLDWVQAALPRDKTQWTFVDLGAGLGRATLAAARRPYARVIGVEFAAELAAIAASVVARDDAVRAGEVEILHMDAARYSLPDGPVVVFLFDPFRPPVIDAVADAVRRSYAEKPRPIIVAYLRPTHAPVFEALGVLTRVALTWREFLLFRLFSPYRLRLYATPECAALWARLPYVGRRSPA